MIAADFPDEIGEISNLYNIAEADLKNIGRIRDALIVTGVNQCRYAGQHLLRALTADDRKKVQDNLDAAKRHVQRAIYDINDSAIQYYLREIDDLRTKHFPTVDFASVVPQYGEIMAALVEVEDLVRTTGDDLSNREQHYRVTRDAVGSLQKAHQTLVKFRPDLARAARKENNKRLVAWVSVAVAALSSLALVVVQLVVG